MNITDKELLTFCNLANLEMEYANLQYNEELDTGETIKRNHTIYSLIDKEVESFKEKKELDIQNEKYDNKKKNVHSAHDIAGAKELRQILDEKEKIKEKLNEKKIGSFCSLDRDEKVTRYIYSSFNELKNNAPLVMERYIRYKEAEDKSPNKFIDEWEIIDYLDNYAYIKYLHDDIIQEVKKSIKKVEVLIKEFEKEVREELGNLMEFEKKFVLFVFNCLQEITKSEIPSFETRDEIKNRKEKKIELMCGLLLLEIVSATAFELKLPKILTEKFKNTFLKVYKKISIKKYSEEIRRRYAKSFIQKSVKEAEYLAKLELKKNGKIEKVSNIFDFIFSKEYAEESIKNTIGNKKLISVVENKIKTCKWLKKVGASGLILTQFRKHKDKVIEDVSSEIVDKFHRTDSVENIKNMTNDFIESNEDEINDITFINELTNLVGFKQEFDISEIDVSLILLRKKNTDDVVIVIKNNLEKINYSINEGNLPEELFKLDMFIEFFKQKYDIKDENVTITGIGSAGVLASIYKIYNPKINCRSFFGYSPKNLAIIADFTQKDIGFFIENFKVKTTIEIVTTNLIGENNEKLYEFITEVVGLILVAVLSPEAAIISILLFCAEKLYNIIIQELKKILIDLKLPVLIKILERNKIIEKNKNSSTNTILGKILEIKGGIINHKDMVKIMLIKNLTSFDENLTKYSKKLIKNLLRDSKKNFKNGIEVKSFKNLITIFFILIDVDKKIIIDDEINLVFSDNENKNIIVYKKIDDRLFKLKMKEYKIKVKRLKMIGEAETRESIVNFKSDLKNIEISNFNSNQTFGCYQNIILKIPENPEKDKNTKKIFENEIDNFINEVIKEGIYFERLEVFKEQEIGDNFEKIVKIYKKLQENLINLIGVSIGIEVNSDTIKNVCYSLNKKKTKEKESYEEDFICFVNEKSGNIEI